MNKRRSSSLLHALHWGALEIAGIYLIIGALWILFSDQMAARVALNQEMLATISLYKGWAYVLITALLLYGLIRRHTARMRAGEMQLQRVLDALPVLISYIDKDQHYRFTNSAYQDWFEGQALGKHIQEVVGTSTYQSILKYIDKVLSGETVRYESEIFLPRGERSISAIYVPDLGVGGQVEGFFTLVQDVTEQKQTLEERRQWADAFEGCAHGIAIGDPNTNRVVVCNPAFAKMHRSSVEDIVGSAILSLYAPLEHEHVRRSIQKADQIGHARFETKMIRKGGSTFPVEMDVVSILGEDGEVLHRVVTAQDISERKQAEEALHNSQAQMTGIFNSAMDAIISTDADQRILIFNRAAETMFRCSQSEALGQPLEQFIPERFREAHRKHVHNFGRSGVTSRAMNGSAVVLGLRSNGEEFPCEASISRIDVAGKKIYTVILRDVTERKQVEEENASLARFPSENPNPVMRATHEGKIIYANSASQSLLQGWHTSVGDYLPVDWIQLIKDLIQTGSGKTIDVQCGETTYSLMIVYAPDANDVNIYGRDITERKRMEEAALESETRYHRLLDSMMEGGQIIGFDWRYVYVNPVAAAQGRRKTEELLGHTMMEIYPGIEQTDLFAVLRHCMEKRISRRLENQFVFPDGRVSWFELSIQPAEEGIFILSTDISERKQGEEYLRRFKLISQHSRDIILFMGRDDGRILEANTAAVRSYGYSREQLLSLTIRDLRASDTLGLTADQMAQADAGGILFETVHRRKDGTTFPVEVSSQGATIGGTRTLISIVRDITERKNAEEALRQSEQRLKRAQEIAHLGSWEFDLVNNHLIWSDEVYRIFGLQPQEFGAAYEAFLEAVHPEDRAAVDAAYSDSIREGRDSYEIEHRVVKRSSREVRFVHEKCEHFKNEDGQIYRSVGMVHDITERKNAEQAMTESEARFRSLFEQSADAYLLLKNGVFSDCNLATVQMMRADRKEQILSTQPAELSPEYQPDGRLSSEKTDEMIRIALEKGSNRFEWIHRRMDGSDFPVEVLLTSISTGDHQVIHAVWRDITEHQQIEQALQAAHDELEIKVQERTAELSEANAFLQALMDYMPDHIYFKDTQSRFLKNSRSQAMLLGLSDPAEAVGKTDFDFFPHAARSFAEEQEVMRSGKPLVDLEEWVVWPDGRETWVSTTKLPLRNSEGQTIGIFGISHDITERKRSEQAIRQLNADLEKQAEQLQAANKELEAFSYSVSHDLRAPLRAIDGYTRILVEDYESVLDEEGKRVCSVISREARRMGQLIDDLLSFSRLGRKEMFSSKIEMRTLVVSVLNELLKDEDRKRIDIHIANLHVAKGDSSLIRQVWVNLLANAIKFTSKKERAIIEVGGKTTKDELIYYVRDNGAGFEMEYANKLFGVFQRLHSESEFSGTGVGLAIVQRIIRRHNGRVWAEGEVEKGATFYFALPRKENLS